MRIAFCLLKYSPYGGLGRDFLRIAQAALARGHEVYIFTIAWQGEVPSGFSVTYIPVSAWTNHGKAYQFAKQLASYLPQKKYDAVVGFNRLPGLDIYFAADPCYYHAAKEKHGLWYRFLPRFRRYMALEKSVFLRTKKTTILLLNPTHKADFIRYYQTEDVRFIHLFPGVAEDRRCPADQRIQRDALRKSMQVHKDDQIILMVGSYFHLKGVDRACRALAALPKEQRDKTYLWILGKGKSRVMQALVKKLKIQKNVQFLGPREDVVPFYAAADMLLHPSRYEVAGMVLIEAIIAGLPILVSRNCGYARYVEQAQAGIVLKDPFEQTDLNQQLLTMLSEKRNLQRYRQNALQYSEAHDFFHLAETVVDIIEAKGQQT